MNSTIAFGEVLANFFNPAIPASEKEIRVFRHPVLQYNVTTEQIPAQSVFSQSASSNLELEDLAY
jgi:hypothetical protein